MQMFSPFNPFTRPGWAGLLLSCIALAACDNRGPILGTDELAAMAPVVIAVTPIEDATGVPITPPITATFDQTMAPIGGASSFVLSCAAPCVAPTGTVALDASARVATFTLTPGTGLEPATRYTGTITAAASLTTGVPIVAPFVWQFTTAPRPTVIAATPLPDATGVPINTASIAASFSEPMAPLSGSASLTLSCAAPCSAPTGSVALDATSRIATLTFAPGTTLAASTQYIATVTGAASLVSGFTLEQPFVWRFRTGAAPDLTRPRVALTAPVTTVPGPTTDVPITAAITATFTEAMAPSSLTGTTTFTLACAAPCVAPAGTVAYSVATQTATFSAVALLTPGTTYTATISTAATDLAGNALAGNQSPLPAASAYLWTFTTQATPTVTAVAPLDGTLGVPINNAVISAAFSEPMAPITGAASLTVACAPPCVAPAGVVTLDPTSQVATFTLGSGVALEPLTLYTATVTGATSLATGLAIAAPYIWRFTTGVAPDVTRPRVVLTTPATTVPGPTTGVPVTTTLTAVFTEDMDPATISAASVRLGCLLPCVAPTGTVTYSVGTRTAQFTPSTPLASDTTYTMRVTASATDLAGNALGGNQAALPAASSYLWTFTTQARPTVTAVAPLDGATGVPINNTLITAAFSEVMAPLTGTASFIVTCVAPCISPVGTVSLDGTFRTATFALGSGVTLQPLTRYTVTITDAASAATGLRLATPFVWQFTTGLAPDTTRPAVILTTPVTTLPGPTPEVPTTTAVTAVFSEDMAPAGLDATSFTLTCALPCVAPTGTVTYSVATRTATLIPSTALAADTTYSARITTSATDLAGNALGGNQAALPAASAYLWTFTTQARPTVTAVAPLDGATGVPINNTVINAAFSEPMAPISGTASFTVTCAAPCVSPTGTVSLDSTAQIATFALGAGVTLQPLTLYTATVTGARSLATGLTLANPFVWRFTTGVAPDTTRPGVILTTPVTSIPGPTTNVPITTLVMAVFSEAMAPATIDVTSVRLGCLLPCVAPTGTVTYSVATRTATFTPVAPLEPGTLYSARVTAFATDLAGNALGGNQAAPPAASSYLWTFTTQARPTVIAVAPLDGATGVPINNTLITAAFSEPMAPLTGTASFTVTCAAPCISPAGTVALDGTFRTATFTLGAGVTLQPLTLYTATVTGARSLATGLALANPFVWRFTTGVAPDTTRPRVTLTVPVTSVPGPTTGVPVTTVMSAVFSEAMAPASLSATSVRLTCVAPCVAPAGTVSYSVATRTATFTPATTLAPGTTYTATITIGATDLAGNALAGNQAALPAASAYIWTFTTQARPTVTAVAPLDGATGVPINNTLISAAFSEPMAPLSGAASFTVTCAAPCVSPAGTVSLDASSRIATFALGSGVTLQPLTLYTATVTGAVSLATGLALEDPFVWRFTTGVAPDLTPPTVIATVPVSNANGVPLNTAITATFSEDMAPASLSGASVTLGCSAPCVAPSGAVAYSVATRRVSFAPGALLASDTLYTVTIAATATDLAGNALVGGYTWSFRTQVRPTVTAVIPLEDATGVPISDPLITATFSEAVAPLTGAASFTLTCAAPCVDPTGTVTLDATSRVATFTLGSGITLAPLTLYTATVTGATSLATNLAMAQPFVWRFTTGATPDTVRPRVASTQPPTTSPGPTPDVPVTTQISAVFTEDMDPATLGSASLSVTCAAPCSSPSGVVSYTPGTRTLRFVPAATLATSTTFTVTVAATAADPSGNTLAGNQAPLPGGSAYVWSFTTQARPTVTAVAPTAGATGVPIDNTIINASFSEAMAPLTGSASFTVTCAAPCTSPAGTVSLDATNRIATFTLDTGVRLEPLTLYTATVTGAASLATGLTLALPFEWQFTTGVTPDATRPRVTSTVPVTTIPGPTPDVLSNTAITAVFSEDMAPGTLNAGSFTVTCTAPCISPTGTVSYAVGTRTADFLPDTVLEDSTTYTATITTGATDLAGNALAGNQAALPAASAYIWTFTTATPVPPSFVTVSSTNPAAGATLVCPTATINATFNVPFGLRMDPATVNTATFTVAGVTASSVVLDGPTGTIATFTPQSSLTAGTTYTATIKGGASGVKDLAVPGNGMVSDFTWSFSVGPATGACLAPIPLGSASSFGLFGGSAGMTNSGTATIINGDIGTTGASSSVTGFHDAGPGCTYTETALNIGAVNGTINTAPPSPTVSCPTEGTAATFAIASQARADALAAYDALVALPAGPDPTTVTGNLAGLVLNAGVYTAAASTFRIQGGDLTLDGQGNADAVFVFQMATTLTVGGPGNALPQSVLLINGAQAKNVFWQVGSAATINAGGGGTMVGTIISQTGAVFSTAGNTGIATLNGRVLSLGAAVTLVNTVINVPPP